MLFYKPNQIKCGPQSVSIHFTFLAQHEIILLIDACPCNIVGKKPNMNMNVRYLS